MSTDLLQGPLISLPVASRHGVFFWFMRTFVRVRYTFFLVALLLGLRRSSPVALLVWVAVVFLAVLLHEVGHAIAARSYGQKPQIELHAMGGVTEWRVAGALSWHERIVISLAGPGIGFLLGGLVYLAGVVIPGGGEPHVLWLARRDFLWATIGWGLFNMLPLLPLDGGQALAALLERWRGAYSGRMLARKASCATGIVGLVLSILVGQVWVGVLCAFLAYDNLQRIRGLPGIQLPR